MPDLDPAEHAAGEWPALRDRVDGVASWESAAMETVTPMRDADREWRVSGYFIR